MKCCGSKQAVLNSVATVPELPENCKHLICDDSSMNRNILRRLLIKMFSIDVDEAEDGETAVKQVLKNGEYAVIWLDFMLGQNEPNGGQVCARLRRELQYKGTIIMLTGYTDPVTREICRAAGANDFVGKPYNSETIRKLSEKHARETVAISSSTTDVLQKSSIAE